MCGLGVHGTGQSGSIVLDARMTPLPDGLASGVGDGLAWPARSRACLHVVLGHSLRRSGSACLRLGVLARVWRTSIARIKDDRRSLADDDRPRAAFRRHEARDSALCAWASWRAADWRGSAYLGCSSFCKFAMFSCIRS